MRFLSLLALTLTLVVAGGCNVFEGFYTEGTSNDPAVILQDAEAALADDRPEDAITYAHKVLEKDSTHVTAINTVAAAEMKAADVDVVTLQEFVDVLTRKAEETLGSDFATASLGAAAADEALCPAGTNYECDFCEVGQPSDYALVEYRDLEAYQRLRDARDAFGRIEATFDPLFNALRDELAEISRSADLRVAFADPADRELIWGLLLQRGIAIGAANPERLAAQFLATVAVVRIARTVSVVSSDAAEQQIAIYKVHPDAPDETFSYCALDLETVEAYVDATVCDQVRELQMAVDILRARQENFSRAATGEDDPVQILIREADDALEDYRESESYGRCGGL